MKDFLLTITATCDSITLDELKQLEGELKRRCALDSVKVSVTPYSPDSPAVTLQHLLHACAKAFWVKPEMLSERNRTQDVAFARHAYCHLAAMYGYTTVQIGAAIARSYSTVVASIKVSNNLIFSNHDLYKQPFEAAKRLAKEYKAASKHERRQAIGA
jgi:chromosomal replication initiation ATPase DnaA